MPVIPQEYIGSNAFPDRPPQADINPEAYGRDAYALSQLGEEIGDIGSRLLSARKHAMENDAVNNATSDDAANLPQIAEKLRQNYQKKNPDGSPLINPDGTTAYDLKGYSDALKAQLDQRMNDNLSAMPTGDAQRMYRERAQHMFNGAYAGAYDWENRTRADQLIQNIEIRGTTRSNGVLNSSDPYHSALTALAEAHDDYAQASGPDGLLNPVEAAKKERSEMKRTYDAMFGAYERDPDMARQGLELIKHITNDPTIKPNDDGVPESSRDQTKSSIFGTGQDASKISQGVDPEQLISYRNRLQAVVGKGNNDDRQHYQAQINGAKTAFGSSDPDIANQVTPLRAQALAVQARDLAARGVIHKDQADQDIMMLVNGVAFRQAKNTISTTPESQKENYDKTMEEQYKATAKAMGIDPLIALGSYKQQHDLSDNLWAQDIAARKKDANQYVEDNNSLPGKVDGGIPDQTRIAARIAAKSGLEIYNNSPYTRQEHDGIISQLKNASENNPDQAIQLMNQIKASSGEYSSKAIDSLTSGQNKLPHYFATAYNSDSPEVAKAILDLSKPENAKAVKESIPEADRKVLGDEVSKAWKPIDQVFGAVGMSGANQRANQEMKKIAELRAIGYKNQGASDTDAAEAATKDIFLNQYHLVGGYAFMPKTINGMSTRPDVIEGAMQAIHDPGAVNRFQVPGSAIGLSAEQRKDAITTGISTGRWVNMVEGDGKSDAKSESSAVFMMRRNLGNGQYAWDIPLRLANGTPVKIDYAKMSLDPTPEALNNVRHAWQKPIGPDGNPVPDVNLFGGVEPITDSVMPQETAGPPNPGLKEQTISKDKIVPGQGPVSDGRDPNSVYPQEKGQFFDGKWFPLPDAKNPAPDAEAKGSLPENVKTTQVVTQGSGSSTTFFQSDKKAKPYVETILDKSDKAGVDPQIIHNFLKYESNFKPKVSSGTGAAGLAQITKQTAKALVKDGVFDKVSDRLIPEKAIDATIKLFSDAQARWGNVKMAVADHLMGAPALKDLVHKYGTIAKAAEHLPTAFVPKDHPNQKPQNVKDYTYKILGLRK